MKVIIVLCAILFCLTNCRLYQVVSISRHGARYHVNDFGDGASTKPLWGELTAVGMRQEQRLGQLLRKEYIQKLGLLSAKYNSSEIEVYSTTYNRTMLSIQSVLYGLFPNGTGPRMTFIDSSWHRPPYSNKTDDEEQNYAFPHAFQPIKVKQNKKILLVDCPNTDKYINQNLEKYADVVKQMNATYYSFFKKLAPLFNFSLSTANFYTMLRVWDVVNVDNFLGRPLPSGFTSQDEANVLHLANWYFAMTHQNNVSLMYTSGKLQRLFTVFENRMRSVDTYPLKWTFLSCHDSDLFSMQTALNLTSFSCIEALYRNGSTPALNCQTGANYFGGSLIFELHSDDKTTFYVKLRSNGKYVKLCNKNQIQCEYSQFKNQYKKFIAPNVQQLCGITRNDKEQQDKQHGELKQI